MKKIALFGGSFNPPAIHHRLIVEELLKFFDEVIVLPCGLRPDKNSTNNVAPADRAAMAKLAFGGMKNVRLDLSDLQRQEFIRTYDLDQLLRAENPEAEIWQVVGADLVAGGRNGQSAIQTSWYRGAELWAEANFAVFTRVGYEIAESDLPPHHKFIISALSGSSTEVRTKIKKGKDFSDLVDSAVGEYIKEKKLYC
jgi:nicotinate (nicotinamide) nucleotide adenylyltransferase